MDDTRVTAWLDDMWPELRRFCPVCTNPNWTLGEVGPSAATRAEAALSSEHQLIRVTCTRCGYTILFDPSVSVQTWKPLDEEQ